MRNRLEEKIKEIEEKWKEEGEVKELKKAVISLKITKDTFR